MKARWREAVSETHLPWDLPRRSEGSYRARVRQQALGVSQIIHCACDPCEGRRGKAEIASGQDTAAREQDFGLLEIQSGGADMAALMRHSRHDDVVVFAPGLFLHDDRVRTGRQFTAGENPHRLSRA